MQIGDGITSRKQQSSTLYVFSEESTGGRNNAEYVSISWCHHVPGTDYKQCSLYYIEVRCNPADISIHLASLHIRSRPNFLHINQTCHSQKKVMAVWVLRHGEEWNHDDVIKWKHFPRYWPFDLFFDLRLNKRLSKQSWGWWFETLSCPLWP